MDRPKRSVWSVAIVLIVIIGCTSCCLLGVLVAMKNAIATHIARERLRERGVECDERFAVSPSWTFDVAHLAPTSCTVADSPIANIESLMPIEIDLGAGEQEAHVAIPQVRITTRDGLTLPEIPGPWGVLVETAQLPSRIGLVFQGACAMARMNGPSVSIGSLEVVQGERTILEFNALEISGRSPMTFTIFDMHVPFLLERFSDQFMSVRMVNGTASESDVQISGDLGLGSTTYGRQRLTVHATALDSTAPRYDISLE